MDASPVSDLRTALATTGGVVAGIRDEQLGASTPCTEWDVAQLAEHLLTSLNAYVAAFGGAAPSPARAGRAADLADRFRDAASRLVAVVDAPDGGQRTVTIPFGTVPAPMAVQLGTVEVLVHGWDLASATGQSPKWDQDVADRAARFSLDAIGAIPEGRSPFAPPRPVDASAPAMQRLVAILGRITR
jgi:uncharacterized protein (TIGR03086 family)